MIYFAKLPSGAIKIGFTKNPTERFRTLKSFYGGLEVLKAQPGDVDDEAYLHARFAHLRIRRTEQFHASPELLSYIGTDDTSCDSSECPPARNMVAVPVVLPIEHWAAIKQQAKDSGRSASAIVRDLVADHLRGKKTRKPKAEPAA